MQLVKYLKGELTVTDFDFLRQNNLTRKESSLLEAQRVSCKADKSKQRNNQITGRKPNKSNEKFPYGLTGYSSVDECLRILADGLQTDKANIRVIHVKRISRKKEDITCPATALEFTGQIINGNDSEYTAVVTIARTGSVRLVALVVRSAISKERNELLSATLPSKLANNIQERKRANGKKVIGSDFCNCNDRGGANYSVGCAWSPYLNGCKWAESDPCMRKFLAAKTSALTAHLKDIGNAWRTI